MLSNQWMINSWFFSLLFHIFSSDFFLSPFDAVPPRLQWLTKPRLKGVWQNLTARHSVIVVSSRNILLSGQHWRSSRSSYLMEGVLPHVSTRQRLIKGEHHRVVFSIWLMAPLSDPAFVVRQRVVETPETGGWGNQNKCSLKVTIIPTSLLFWFPAALW